MIGCIMANRHADLGALTVSRPSSLRSEVRMPRRWMSRVVLPFVLIAGFAGLAAWASWDRLVPPLGVSVLPVQVQTGQRDITGLELFRANGWIEPFPRPLDVPVQTESMYRVMEVLVNPGDQVKLGQELIRLDRSQAELVVDAAKKKHGKRMAMTKTAQADVAKADVAIANAEAAVTLVKLEGNADVKAMTAEETRAEAHLRTVELTVTLEEELWKSKAVTSDAKLRQAKQMHSLAFADCTAASARLDKARVTADVRIKLAQQAIATAQAERASLLAKVEEAQQEAEDAAVEIRKAQLEYDRTRIVAPTDGIVMGLAVRPGRIVGGKDSVPESKGALVTLYDPKSLQVRVEVPVNKFAFVRRGGTAEVELEDVLPGKKLTGEIIYDANLANISRNSVPVMVRLTGDVPVELRPDMIAAVRFQSPQKTPDTQSETTKQMLIPRKFLVTDGDRTNVWAVDPMGRRAELKAVELAAGEKDRNSELVTITSGLNPTDKLIATNRERLQPGLRINVVGEER
jgi:HlyD family secretion protein